MLTVQVVKGQVENPTLCKVISYHDNDRYRTSRSPNRAPISCATQTAGHSGHNPLVDGHSWSGLRVASPQFKPTLTHVRVIGSLFIVRVITPRLHLVERRLKPVKAFVRTLGRTALITALVSLALVSIPNTAHAATSAGAGGTVTIAPNLSGVINNLLPGTASDVQALNFGSETVTAVISSNLGNIGITSGTGLTVLSGYQTNLTDSATTIGFYGNVTDVNNALNTLKYWAGASTGSATISVTLSDRGNNVTYDPATGAYYQYVSTAVTWEGAYNAITGDNLTSVSTTANVSTRQNQTPANCAYKFNGMCGYFATVYNATQNAFINSKVGSTQVWLGGSDRVTEGTWVWSDPKAPAYGKRFSNQNGYGASGSTGEGVNYTVNGTQYNYVNWNGSEPNNSGGESALQMLSGSTGNWNDLNEANATMGYVVEYGGISGETVSYAAATTTINVNIAYASTISVGLTNSATTATYRAVSQLTATISPDGKVTFYANGKAIPGCKNKSGTTSATCNWKPAQIGRINITASFVPNSNNYPNSAAPPALIVVSARGGTR